MIPAAIALEKALKKSDFPASKSDLLRKYPQRQIYLSSDHPSNLEDVLRHLPQERFQSLSELADAIDQAITRF